MNKTVEYILRAITPRSHIEKMEALENKIQLEKKKIELAKQKEKLKSIKTGRPTNDQTERIISKQ